jgi:hypothetical protein
MAHADIEKCFTGTVAKDLFSLVRGELLGEGVARHVYGYDLDESLVMKFEIGGQSFQNVAEWEVWRWARGTSKARWLAPCISISPSGSVLLQKRVEPLPRSQRPKRLPAWLSDVKTENFGILDGKVVCCDYGTTIVAIRQLSNKLVAREWHA